MKLRKLMTLALAVVMTTAVFTGCGSSESSEGNAEDESRNYR